MRERKYVKFRVDMLSDTKAKIIDRKPERDLIHYIWMALVLLAGKVNLYGELYLSKNIPYTIETLAIELNREVDQVRLALDTLMELEMVEFTEENIYRVKNFAKHQNIKVKEKVEVKEKINEQEKQINQSLGKEVSYNKYEETDNKISKAKKVEENIVRLEIASDSVNSSVNNDKVENDIGDIENKGNGENIIQFERADDVENLIENADIEIENKNIININGPKEKSTMILEASKNRKAGKEKNKDKPKNNRKDKSFNITDEETEEELLMVITDGELTLSEGEKIKAQWSF